MAVKLTIQECAVLRVLRDNSEYQFNSWTPEIMRAIETEDFDVADAVCRRLRQRKLVDGDGKGKWAQYGSNEKGNAALAAAEKENA